MIRIEEAGISGEAGIEGEAVGEREQDRGAVRSDRSTWELHLQLTHPVINHGLGTGAPWLWGFWSGWLLPGTCVRTLPGGFSPGGRANVPWCLSQLQCVPSQQRLVHVPIKDVGAEVLLLGAWGFFSWPVSVILDDLNTAFSDTK